jgi:hypothetical protein
MALGIVGLTLGSASTASAQLIYVGPRYYAPGLPPGEIIRIVQRAGFVPLSAPMRRGPNYVVIATGRGGQMRVVVNAFAGDIVRINPVIAMRPFGPPVSAYGVLPPGYQPMPPSAAYPPPPPAAAAPPPPPSGSAAVPPPAATRSAPAVTRSEPTVTGRASAGLDSGTLPAPSRGFGNPKLANVAPSGTTASVAPKLDSAAESKPEKTPLPRPRPSVAANNAPAAAISAAPTTASAPAPVSSFRRRSVPAVAPGDLPPDTDTAPAAKPAAPAMVPVAPLD